MIWEEDITVNNKIIALLEKIFEVLLDNKRLVIVSTYLSLGVLVFLFIFGNKYPWYIYILAFTIFVYTFLFILLMIDFLSNVIKKVFEEYPITAKIIGFLLISILFFQFYRTIILLSSELSSDILDESNIEASTLFIQYSATIVAIALPLYILQKNRQHQIEMLEQQQINSSMPIVHYSFANRIIENRIGALIVENITNRIIVKTYIVTKDKFILFSSSNPIQKDEKFHTKFCLPENIDLEERKLIITLSCWYQDVNYRWHRQNVNLSIFQAQSKNKEMIYNIEKIEVLDMQPNKTPKFLKQIDEECEPNKECNKKKRI